MFDEKYIHDKIDVIFDVELDSIRQNEFYSYVEKRNEPNTFIMAWQTYTTLGRLYNFIENNLAAREIFVNNIKDRLLDGYSIIIENNGTRECHDSTFLAFYLLMKIGRYADAIETVKKRYIITRLKYLKESRLYYSKSRRHAKKGEGYIMEQAELNLPHQMQGLFEDILMFIRFEPSAFEYNVLDILKQVNKKIEYSADSTIKDDFAEVINAIQYRKLQDELLLENEEINNHKNEVIRLLSKMEFPDDVGTYLLILDSMSESSQWGAIRSDMVRTLDFFFDELIDNIATLIEIRNSENYLGSPMDCIKKNLGLSDGDVRLIASFISILHTKGDHIFLSNKRYFVFTRNIGVEIAYLLLSSLKDFMGTDVKNPSGILLPSIYQ